MCLPCQKHCSMLQKGQADGLGYLCQANCRICFTSTGITHKAQHRKIEMVQSRCVHYVNFDRTNSVTSLLNSLSWPTLEERQRQYRLAVMYRILHNQVDIHWQSFLTKTSCCTRGHSCRLFVPFCKNHVYVSSFFPTSHQQRME